MGRPFDVDRDRRDRWRHLEQYRANETWDHPSTAWERSPNDLVGEGMGVGWDGEQVRFGGIGGLQPLGTWDYRDVGGYARGYSGPSPDEEGPFRGWGPKGWVRSNDDIQEDLCQALTDDPWIDARDIEVEVEDGEVTLRGTVPNRDQKRMVDTLAHRIPGVRDVHNRLTLGGRRLRPRDARYS